MKIDIKKAAHDLALAYAKSGVDTKKFETQQEKLNYMLEDYCTAFGFITSRPDDYIEKLVEHGE